MQVIVCSLTAAGVGINLQVSSNVVLAELSWTAAEQTQAIDRVHRIGQDQPVTAWRILAAQTVDTRVAELIDAKAGLAARALDGADDEDGEAVDIQLETLVTLLTNALTECSRLVPRAPALGLRLPWRLLATRRQGAQRPPGQHNGLGGVRESGGGGLREVLHCGPWTYAPCWPPSTSRSVATRCPSRPIRIEHDGPVIRVVSVGDGWNGLVWSQLDESNADAVIAAEVARFSATGHDWEWKYYSYDQPDDLPERLRAAGLVADPEESLMVVEIADLDVDVAPPEGVRLVAGHRRSRRGRPGACGERGLRGAARRARRTHPLRLGRSAADPGGRRRDGGGAPDRRWAGGASRLRGVRELVGRGNRPGLAAEGSVPLAGRLPSGDRARPRLPLPAGRRIRSQPPDPAAARLRRAGQDHAVPSGLDPSLNRHEPLHA